MQTGAKCESSDVIEVGRDFGEKVFSDICPSKVDMRGKSKLKQLVAEQMLTVVSPDVSVRFESKCAKLCRSVGDLSKKSACRVVRSAFSGNWEDVPASCESPLKRIFPDEGTLFTTSKFVRKGILWQPPNSSQTWAKRTASSPSVPPCLRVFPVTASLTRSLWHNSSFRTRGAWKRGYRQEKTAGRSTTTGCGMTSWTRIR